MIIFLQEGKHILCSEICIMKIMINEKSRDRKLNKPLSVLRHRWCLGDIGWHPVACPSVLLPCGLFDVPLPFLNPLFNMLLPEEKNKVMITLTSTSTMSSISTSTWELFITRQLFITRRKNFITLYISRIPLLYRIPAGQSSSGKLGGREVKTSALVSRRSWVQIPPETPVKFFSQTLGKHRVYSAIHASV